jgi:hypothetical protein
MNSNNTYYTLDTPQGNIWNPDSLNNKHILTNTGIQSNWNYRQYMQKNANQIMKYNTMQSIYSSGNNPYTLLNNDTTNNTPHLYTSLHDTNNPPIKMSNSDLKQNYMTKEQMRSRMIAPSIPTDVFK